MSNESAIGTRQPAIPAGVVFDMDGVLVDSAAAHWESWRRLAEECGAPAGVQAAKAAGCRVAAVMLHHDAAALAGADLVVARLHDLAAVEVLRLVEA